MIPNVLLLQTNYHYLFYVASLASSAQKVIFVCSTFLFCMELCVSNDPAQLIRIFFCTRVQQ